MSTTLRERVLAEIKGNAPKLRAPRPGEKLTWVPKRTPTAIPPRKPAEPSAVQLRMIVDEFLAEAAAAEDPDTRSAFYRAAGNADARARAAEGRERPDPTPPSKAQIDRWVAEARERYPG